MKNTRSTSAPIPLQSWRRYLLLLLCLALTLAMTSCSYFQSYPKTDTAELHPTSEDDIWTLTVEETSTEAASATLALPDKGNTTPDTTTDEKQSPSTEATTLISSRSIFWRVPEQQNISHYLLRYGFQPQTLDKEISISPKELLVVKDSVQGKLYRFELPLDPEVATEVYFTIQAFSNDNASEQTPMMRMRTSAVSTTSRQ